MKSTKAQRAVRSSHRRRHIIYSSTHQDTALSNYLVLQEDAPAVRVYDINGQALEKCAIAVLDTQDNRRCAFFKEHSINKKTSDWEQKC